MKHDILQAEKKPQNIKATQLRKQGIIPCVLFGEKEDSIDVAVQEKTLIKTLGTGHKILQIQFDGQKYLVNIDSVQRHPVTRRALHVAFHRIKMNEKTKVTIPIHYEGSPAGEKEGGVFVQMLSEVEIITLPTNVPENLTIDVSDLVLGGNKLVSDLVTPSGVEFNEDDLEKVICTCSQARVEKEEETPASGEEGAEGEASGEAAPQEDKPAE